MAITKASDIIREATREDPRKVAARMRQEKMDASRGGRMATGALKRATQGASAGAAAGPKGAIIGGILGLLGGLVEEGFDATPEQKSAVDSAMSLAGTVTGGVAGAAEEGAKKATEETAKKAMAKPKIIKPKLK